jgi:hypothetical protein
VHDSVDALKSALEAITIADITKKKSALSDAAEWDGKPNKLDLLEE